MCTSLPPLLLPSLSLPSSPSSLLSSLPSLPLPSSPFFPPLSPLPSPPFPSSPLLSPSSPLPFPPLPSSSLRSLLSPPQVTLRRLVYLAIKDMAKIANDVIIVTSSLTKDMTGKEDQYRASAIRALCTITDVSWSVVAVIV